MRGCLRHPEAEFVSYVDTSRWHQGPVTHWACPICLGSFRAFCREINLLPKDRPLFHGLRCQPLESKPSPTA